MPILSYLFTILQKLFLSTFNTKVQKDLFPYVLVGLLSLFGNLRVVFNCPYSFPSLSCSRLKPFLWFLAFSLTQICISLVEGKRNSIRGEEITWLMPSYSRRDGFDFASVGFWQGITDLCCIWWDLRQWKETCSTKSFLSKNCESLLAFGIFTT